ncbi:gtp pyrophosphokinase [Ligilactobacillus hayakitensis DSM 18933 = JCM 14209]|uniref:Gtp pyrophosphokinase n=1 Tax=Ligilactobacillus hayakitensis DSM 18933 = JCM 14209 TaxID=1423755 RepID=A0A0R1WSS1_9LACO|nr:GTP pyrophosphokinase family protein [Ligilactobacillus hayakitensis]KRM19220.1 gtp pyrophosphokinase [Ligilactobacillus hayakitensis DSM 18933 = JCM 14209]
MDWSKFLNPYEQTVNELKLKLREMRKQYKQQKNHAPIEFVTGRVKSVESIEEKMQRRQLTEDRLDEMEDIAGVRIMCQFVEDIYQVVSDLRKRKDMKITEERDYVTNNKSSGYRSYHMVVEYPLQQIDGEKIVKAEIQIRTLAMNFWATIEHSLNYKYQGNFPTEIAERLKNAAEAAFMLDNEMSRINENIKEAQQYFTEKKNYNNRK